MTKEDFGMVLTIRTEIMIDEKCEGTKKPVLLIGVWNSKKFNYSGTERSLTKHAKFSGTLWKSDVGRKKTAILYKFQAICGGLCY